ncbi:MAG: flavodoxin domain-containing protein [Candidatus Marinimicrobia bacterium]|nr:flavodoxin domain-containing protein [Candidatus Neomarinimicrobiota bacterium]
MGKILILYDSNSGNTEKMARLVAEGATSVPGMKVKLKTVKNVLASDVTWCDGIAVGSPTHMGVLSWSMKKFWDEIGDELWGKIDGKIGCAFSSSGGWGGGNELACQSILTVLINYGFLVFGLPDYVDEKLTLHYGAVTAGEPRSDGEKKSCRLLGIRLAEWVAVFFDHAKKFHPRQKR